MALKQTFKAWALAVAGVALLSVGSQAYAAHGSYNPMMPRQLSATSAQADYSYGFSILAGNAIDTLEPANRAMWYLNYDLFDRYLLRPIAHGYAKLPQGVQDGVGNFLSNIDEVNNIPNNLLVGDVDGSLRSVGRFIVNSTIGILGFFDVATAIGLNHTPMPMEVVLGKAGVDQGPFLMIPAYGPTTARDIHGAVIDGLPFYAISWPVTIAHWAVSGIHNRAQLIPQEGVVDNALDPYIQTRDVFLMYDENAINPVEEGEVEAEDNFDAALLEEIDG